MYESRETVALIDCASYAPDRLEKAMASLAEVVPLGQSQHGKVVLLKPNLISSLGNPLSCTHPNFIGAVAAWYKNHGARVIVGDSPAFGSAAGVCDKFGVTEILRKIDVEIVNFHTAVRRKLAGGITVPIARCAMECDLFVGLPKIKAHNQMFVSLAMKNIFGIVTGMSKAMLHMVHGSNHQQFAEIILALQTVLPPQMHIADGIEVMHRTGPLHGDLLALNCLGASASPVALDVAIHALLELDPGKSPLLLAAAARGDWQCRADRLHFPLERPQRYHSSGFVAPNELNPVRFNPFRFLRGFGRRCLLKLGL